MTPVFARHSAVVLALGLVAFAQPQDKSAVDLGQSVADALRAVASADVAFVPKGALVPGPGDLAAQVQFPTDSVVVATLTGTQVMAALRRATSTLPEVGSGYLFVSGLSFGYAPSRPADDRVSQVTVGENPIDAAKKYRVVMPLSLAKGGQGYFKVWPDGAKNATAFGTLEEVLKGKVVVVGQVLRARAIG